MRRVVNPPVRWATGVHSIYYVMSEADAGLVTPTEFTGRHPAPCNRRKLGEASYPCKFFTGVFLCASGMVRSAVTGDVLQLWWLKND